MADRAFQATRGRRLAVLLAGGSLLTTAAVLPAQAVNTFTYGIDDKQQILQVDLTDKNEKVIFKGAPFICSGLDPTDAALCGGANGGLQRYYSNNFAYDDVRRQFYFMDFRGNLRYWDFNPSSTLPVIAGKETIGLDQVSRTSTQFTANGSYYNDAFYYFIDSTAPNGGGSPPVPSPDRYKLVKFDMTFGPDGKPTGGTATKLTVSGLEDNFTFGDIAIDSTGKLYGANVNGAFFSLNLDQCPGASCAAQYLINSTDNKVNPSLQIAFDQDYQTLYGHTFEANTNGSTTEAGGWGTVDTATGIYSPYQGSDAFSTTPLRDIAGASEREVVPGPLPVLGAGAAFGWTRRLRRRLTQAGSSSR